MTARRFRTPRRREPARRPRGQRCGLAPLRRESPVPSARRPRRAERSRAGAISAMAGLWLISAGCCATTAAPRDGMMSRAAP